MQAQDNWRHWKLSPSEGLAGQPGLPGMPGVLRHSVKLRTSTPGYNAERACREVMLNLARMMMSPTQ
jgi:hypothetical protein